MNQLIAPKQIYIDFGSMPKFLLILLIGFYLLPERVLVVVVA